MCFDRLGSREGQWVQNSNLNSNFRYLLEYQANVSTISIFIHCLKFSVKNLSKQNTQMCMLCFDKIFFNLKIIFRYLLEYQANVSAVNNDGELAIDISESDEMEELLQKEIDKQGINCDESRNTEERLMLEDARSWLNAKVSSCFGYFRGFLAIFSKLFVIITVFCLKIF